MNKEVDYEGYFHFDNYTWENNSSVTFNPASMSKLFIVDFLFASYRKEVLENTYITLVPSRFFKYKSGTVKLSLLNLYNKFSLLKLVEFSLLDSCNISTGLLADFLDRVKINKYIKTVLKLKSTTIYSQTTLNKSTISDFKAYLLNLINKTELVSLLKLPKRRAVLSNLLGDKYVVISKGGTTFLGERREMGVILDKKGKEVGNYVVIQKYISKQCYSIIDKILARFHFGIISETLNFLNNDFNDFLTTQLANSEHTIASQ